LAAATNCAALPTANAGQYTTSRCKLLLKTAAVWFSELSGGI